MLESASLHRRIRSIADELARREERSAKHAAARAKIEARAEERYE
jgi:hypothetical protein